MKRILIVDDEVNITDFLCDLLQEEGYQPTSASNGLEALSLIERTQPDLILSDMMMPLMSGEQLCRALTAHPSFRRIPLVLMSAGVKPSLSVDCHYAGFLAKPFDFDHVLKMIEQTLTE